MKCPKVVVGKQPLLSRSLYSAFSGLVQNTVFHSCNCTIFANYIDKYLCQQYFDKFAINNCQCWTQFNTDDANNNNNTTDDNNATDDDTNDDTDDNDNANANNYYDFKN